VRGFSYTASSKWVTRDLRDRDDSPRPLEPGAALAFSVIFFGVLVLIGAEIAAFVAVADQVGFLLALLILIGVSALGPFVVKRVGFGVLVHTQERLARGEVPTRELFDGLVVLAAGVMICIPGFIGDALGLLLMIGPVRHLVIRASGRHIARRVQTIRTSRWRVIDAHGGPTRNDTPSGPGRPRQPLGPGNPVSR
jgi:UPF0716 protein FxsA